MSDRRDDFRGMTLNERLLESGLLEEFDRAGRARDRDTMTRLLVRVELTSEEAARAVEEILADPKKYGF